MMFARAHAGGSGEKGPLEATLELIVAAAGVVFLALGLRQWVAIAWANDTAAARTPVAYGAHVELPAETHMLLPAIKWVILLSGASTAPVCANALEGVAVGPQAGSVGIIVAGGPVARLAACSGSSRGQSSAVEMAVIHRDLGWIPASGFIVVDRAGRVVYGSFDLAYLARVLPSLAVLN